VYRAVTNINHDGTFVGAGEVVPDFEEDVLADLLEVGAIMLDQGEVVPDLEEVELPELDSEDLDTEDDDEGE